MSAMVQDTSMFSQQDSISLGYGVPGRPRAATVSMCRYTIPESPISKPTASPATSPPSLILPPPGGLERGLCRSSSRISNFDERLASSAPTTVHLLGAESDIVLERIGMLREAVISSPDFTLLTLEDNVPYEPQTVSMNEYMKFGMDDQADATPHFNQSDVEDDPVTFSASPILMSCLRDISRRPKQGFI